MCGGEGMYHDQNVPSPLNVPVPWGGKTMLGRRKLRRFAPWDNCVAPGQSFGLAPWPGKLFILLLHCLPPHLSLILFLSMSYDEKYNAPSKKRRLSFSTPKKSMKGASIRQQARSYTSVQRGVGPFSPRAVTTLKYCERITVNCTAGVPNIYQFNVNSIYDPNRTGTGHQPYGFDQWAGIYGRYKVFAVSYRILFYNSTGAGNQGITILMNNSTASLGTDYNTIMELPRSINSILSSQYTQPKLMKGHIYLPRLNGSTKEAYMADDRFQAQISANPTETMIMHIVNYIESTTSNVEFEVQFKYHVEFFDPLTFASS